MSADADWAALDAALAAALDLDGLDREAYLQGLDPALGARVRRLVGAALRDDTLLDAPRAALEPLAADLAPVHVEGYAVGALIGEGGMGRVYRGTGPGGEAVALKVVRPAPGASGELVVARLRREQALLAGLDHPGIARFVDAAETADGDPVLVMEFVDGVPITDWANARRLGVAERVGLVVDVARAVAHAHDRGVVHRDLKPSNVLVAQRGGGAAPVVLDFGIGKLLSDGPEGALTRLTRTGHLLMTPAYAPPELADARATVTPATDVFSLAVLLYELLVCVLPYKRGAQHAPSPPPPPAPLVAVGAGGGPTAAAFEAVNAACLRGLHPDPQRRFATAAAFADALGQAFGADAMHPGPPVAGS